MSFLETQVLRSEPGAPITIEPRLRITDPQVSDRAELVLRTSAGPELFELYVIADPLLDMAKVIRAINEEAEQGAFRDAVTSGSGGLAWIETYGGFAWTLDHRLYAELLGAVTA